MNQSKRSTLIARAAREYLKYMKDKDHTLTAYGKQMIAREIAQKRGIKQDFFVDLLNI